MFNENFSFCSSTSNIHSTCPDDCSSANISPCDSRISSPRLRQCMLVSSTSRPSQRGSRFDSYQPHHTTITALTAELESHNLTSQTLSPPSSLPPSTPSDRSLDPDEGFFDGPDTPASTASDYSSNHDQPFWDRMMTEHNTTPSPRSSLSLEARALSSYTARRQQRQALVRLQCLVKTTPELAMLLEECHPSSMPWPQDHTWTMSNRSNSTTSLAGCTHSRVAKTKSSTPLVRKAVRRRRRPRRSIA